MRAVQITRFGGPEVLDVVELPDPTPGEGQQLFDVSTAGVNYADTHHALPQDMPEPGRRGGPQSTNPAGRVRWDPNVHSEHRRSPGPRCGISPRSRC